MSDINSLTHICKNRINKEKMIKNLDKKCLNIRLKTKKDCLLNSLNIKTGYCWMVSSFAAELFILEVGKSSS